MGQLEFEPPKTPEGRDIDRLLKKAGRELAVYHLVDTKTAKDLGLHGLDVKSLQPLKSKLAA